MEVTFFSRKKNQTFFSIEELFCALQKQFSNVLNFQNHEMPYESKGFLNRLLNGTFAKSRKGAINHITGDVHYLALFLPRKSTILTIHDCGELDKKKGIKKFILWLFWFYLPVKRLHYITVISEATRSHLLRYVKTNPDKIHVISNCLIGNFIASHKPFNEIKPKILHVGVTPNKNIERIVEALQGVSCELTIIGKPSPSQLEILRDNNIEFCYKYNLSREQVILEYANCDMLIFVSLLEGFGLPIIEAQASGKPVVTSNLAPMNTTAGNNGACFVDPYQATDIRRGVLRVIQDSAFREKIIFAGLENSKRFNPHTISKEYLKLYNKVSTGKIR